MFVSGVVSVDGGGTTSAYATTTTTATGNPQDAGGGGEAGSSPGLPLSLPADPAPSSAPAGSPDPSLTVLQPANNGVGVGPYATMLPTFQQYATGRQNPLSLT